MRNYIVTILLLCMFQFMATDDGTAEQPFTRSKIIDIKTSPSPNINQWVTLPHGKSGTLEITAEVDGTDVVKVNFWLLPTKNKSWKNSWDKRQIIYEDTDGSDGWMTTLQYGDKSLLHFVVVELVNGEGQSDFDWFYVVYRK